MRTPAQDRQLIQLAETESQRALGRSVSCDDCSARIDRPCITRHGRELRAEHPHRLKKAERARSAGVIACEFCRRLALPAERRESEPYPEVIEMCDLHQQLQDELAELVEVPDKAKEAW